MYTTTTHDYIIKIYSHSMEFLQGGINIFFLVYFSEFRALVLLYSVTSIGLKAIAWHSVMASRDPLGMTQDAKPMMAAEDELTALLAPH